MPRQPDYHKRLAALTRELADTLTGLIASEAAKHVAAAPAGKRGRRSAAAVKVKRAPMKLSRAARAQRVLQGKYMSMIRQIPKSGRAAFKKLRTDKGYGPAMAALARAIRAK